MKTELNHGIILRRIVLSIITGIVILIGIKAIPPRYEKYKKMQALIAQGIYEINDSQYYLPSYYSPRNTASAYFMVCNPPGDIMELVEKIDLFVEENCVRERILQKYSNDYSDFVIELNFYKPSKKYPAGWQYYDKWHEFESAQIGKNCVLAIYIPWGAEAKEEFIYRVFEQDDEKFNSYLIYPHG